MVSAFFRDIGVRATVENVSGYERDLGRMRTAEDRNVKNLQDFANQAKIAGAVITGLGVGTTFVGKQLVDMASDVRESVNAVNVVFGSASEIILNFGQTADRSVGLSVSAFNQLASQAGGLLVTTGKPINEVADLTIQLTQRAADLASVFNTDVNDAFLAITSAIRGETEPIRRFTGDVTDATLQQYALSQGITTSTQQMTEQQKRLLRLGLIMQQTQRYAGDFARTSNEFANSQRRVASEVANLASRLGKDLIPLALGLLGVTERLITVVEGLDPVLFGLGVRAAAVATALALIVGPSLIVVGFLPQIAAGFGLVATSLGAVSVAMVGPAGILALLIAGAGALTLFALTARDAKPPIDDLVGSFTEWKEAIKGLGLEDLNPRLIAQQQNLAKLQQQQRENFAAQDELNQKVREGTISAGEYGRQAVTLREEAQRLNLAVQEQASQIGVTEQAIRDLETQTSNLTNAQTELGAAVGVTKQELAAQGKEHQRLIDLYEQEAQAAIDSHAQRVKDNQEIQRAAAARQKEIRDFTQLAAVTEGGAEILRQYTDGLITLQQAQEALNVINDQTLAKGEFLTKRNEEIRDSWAKVTTGVEDATDAFKQANLDMVTAVRIIAAETGLSAVAIITSLREQGVATDDVRGALDQYGIAADDALEAQERLQAQVQSTTDAMREQAAAAISIGLGPGATPGADVGTVRALFEQLRTQALSLGLLGVPISLQEFQDIANSFVQGGGDVVDAFRQVLARIRSLAGEVESGLIEDVGTLPAFAHGGVQGQSGMAIVGEKGPEMVSLPAGALVRPTQTVSRDVSYNVNANYSNPQEPHSILQDLQGLAMLAGV